MEQNPNPEESIVHDESVNPRNTPIPTESQIVEVHSSEMPDSIEIQDNTRKDQEDQKEESDKTIRRLKIISLTISILAGVGSLFYYAYSVAVGDTMILKPADTVIIQNSDLQLDQEIKNNKTTEQSVIDTVIKLQKSKRDFIPLDYFVGKILEVSVPVKDIRQPLGTQMEKMDIKIQKTYDIANKRRLDETVNCTLDNLNVRYFQKWKEMENNELEIPGKIKIRENDLIGFRYTNKNNNNTCELFQINNTNLQEYIGVTMKLFSQIDTTESAPSIIGKIENFSNDYISNQMPMMTRYNSGALFNGMGFNNDMYSSAPVIVYMTTYFDENPLLPMANISCKLNRNQVMELGGFYMRSNLQPTSEKERVSLKMKPNGTSKIISILSKDNNGSLGIYSEWIQTHQYDTCNLETINILDMGQRNIIDSYTFGSQKMN